MSRVVPMDANQPQAVMMANGQMAYVQQQPGMVMQQQPGMVMQQQPGMVMQQQPVLQHTSSFVQQQAFGENGAPIMAVDGSELKKTALDGGKTEAAQIKDKTKAVNATKDARDGDFIMATLAAKRTALQDLRALYGSGKAFTPALEKYIEVTYRNPEPIPENFVPLSEASIKSYMDQELGRKKSFGNKVNPPDLVAKMLPGASIKIMRRGQIKDVNVEQPPPLLTENEPEGFLGALCAPYGLPCFPPGKIVETEQDPRKNTYIYKLCEEGERPDTNDIQSEEYRGHTKITFALAEPAKSGPFKGQTTLVLDHIANGEEIMAKFEEWWM
jgi:hypothetical protein